MTAVPIHASVGNGARFAACPLSGGGTPLQVWLAADRSLPALDLTPCREIVVVGAHPDDETLGFGATTALLAELGVRVQVVSATDGGASYPGLSLLQRYRLEQVRRAELHRAAGILGTAAPICLGLPDGEIADHQERLADLLSEMLAARPPGTWCAATWRGDGHPDHEAVGRAAATAVERTGAVLVEYPVWMWHWAHPGDDRVPWNRAFRVDLPPHVGRAKAHAVRAFRSQLVPLGPDPADAPILPPALLRRFTRPFEVVFR